MGPFAHHREDRCHHFPARFTAHKLKKVGAHMNGIVHRFGGANEEVLTFGSVRAFIDAIDSSPDSGFE